MADNWKPLKKVIETIEKMGTVTWGKIPKAKYINIRIDTRDKHCLLFDGDNNLMTIEELEKAIEEDPYNEYKE